MAKLRSATRHIVVDGSNIATEGRSVPSLTQLEDAVGALAAEFPDSEITVIVDASFSHRIDAAELERFDKGVLDGAYVHPPAGAIGRGDAFLLRVAEKVGAVVLSNDSFQEFHGEHPWLFERDRLIGATPVPGVGWIFSPRTPVRGPASRRAVRDSEKERRRVTKAIEVATKEAVSPSAGRKRSRRTAGTTAAGEGDGPARGATVEAAAVSTVNDPLTFISFIAEHPLGAEVQGHVESYTSHGAVVFVGSAQCYVPLANMASPAPRSAREVVKRGEDREFVVTALDPQRRGVELALPGMAEVSGRPSEETIAAELKLVRKAAKKAQPAAAKKAQAAKKAAKKAPKPAKEAPPERPEAGAPARKASKKAEKEAPAKSRSAPAGQAAQGGPKTPARRKRAASRPAGTGPAATSGEKAQG